MCAMLGFGNKRIYLDYASAPPVLPVALEAMRDAAQYSGNPGAIHSEGVAAKRALETARENIAPLLGIKARELIFTSGLTESNNIALLGHARALERKKRGLAETHWIVSSIEHSSVLDCFGEIERLGGEVSYIEPDERGIVRAEKVAFALTPKTVLVSVGWANNEIGTIQPLAEIARTLAEHEEAHGTTVLLHADAGQAPLYLAAGLNSLGVDLCAIGGNKLYGPHGVGALFVRNRADVVRVTLGGAQERNLRPGTESVALAAGFAAAFEDIARLRQEEARRVRELRDSLAQRLTAVPDLVVNGDLKRALPHMLNVSVPGVQSEYVTLKLDQAGIAVSTKSACREGEESISHVVDALGGEAWRARNTFRFSLGQETTADDIAYTAGVFTQTIASLR